MFGIDPSVESIELLNRSGIQGKVGNIFGEIHKELKGKFDVVACTEVLEHIYDLKEAILILQMYLKEDGYLFIDVPAVEGFEGNLLPIANYFNYEHINYFGIHALDNLLGRFGYRRMNSRVDSYGRVVLHNKKEELCIRAIYHKTPNENNSVVDVESRQAICNYFTKINEKNHELA